MLSPDHGEGGVVGDKVFAPGVHRTLDVPDGRHLVTSFEILLALALAPQTAVYNEDGHEILSFRKQN